MSDATGSGLGPFWWTLAGSCLVHQSICATSAALHGHLGHLRRLRVVLDAYTKAHEPLSCHVLDHTSLTLGSHLICILQAPGNRMVWSPAARTVSHSVHPGGCVKQKTWQSASLDSQNKSPRHLYGCMVCNSPLHT